MLSRRQFLVGSAMVAGGSLAGLGWSAHQPLRQHYSAIVVGSGYGGGVSALRLGQAGTDTLVLEKGRLWDTPDADGKRFTQMVPADNRAGWFSPEIPSLVPSYMGFSLDAVSKRNAPKLPRQAGICEKVTHDSHSVFRGVAVGGGSMVNGAIAAIPTPGQVRDAFPDIDAGTFLGRYIERARSILRINFRDMPWFEQTPWYQYARVGRQYAAAAGYSVDYNGSAYSFDYMRREEQGEVPRSSLAAEQQYGNNYGRFGSVDQTYIAAALATGKVSLKPLTEVRAIRRERSGEYVVSTREIDRWGTELSLHEIGCDQLYLSAGVLGTVELLLRARETGALPDLSEEIGRGYGTNGDIMISHMLADNTPAGTQQSIMGMINIDGRDDPDNPVYASVFSLPLPAETYAMAYYVMVRTGDRGDILYKPESDSITIRWPQDYTDNAYAKARMVFDKITAANGVDYRDDLFKGKPYAPHTVHPLGGCLRGRATDAYGRVCGYTNFHVNDASLIPGYIGCNPFMTITALAERNIEGVLQGRN